MNKAKILYSHNIQDDVDYNTSSLGGKAEGLIRLVKLGLTVPAFAVLDTSWFQLACPDGVIPECLPTFIKDKLSEVWDVLKGDSCSLAVRSSAIGEDGESASFAGQMDTFLNVTSLEALSNSVLDCWLSLYGERALAYRKQQRIVSDVPPEMGVVIQKMINPEVSGVLFTVNPVSGRWNEMMISSVWGLGEGLVSGELDADTFVMDASGTLIRSDIAEKEYRISYALDSGTETTKVQEKFIKSSSLSESQLSQLFEKAHIAEEYFNRALDIEFCVKDEQIYFLQARPVTAFAPIFNESDGNRYVWDNSNINESYPGITSPLTFSFIQKAYYSVYWQFCEMLGIHKETIREQTPMLENMLGLIQGRVYYNLLNWYGLVSMMPGFEFNKVFMEAMMGLEEPDDLQKPAQKNLMQTYCIELPQLILVGLRMIFLQITLPKQIQKFHQNFNTIYKKLNAIDYNTIQPYQSLKYYDELEAKVLWRWKAPIVNDFSAMIFYGLLKKLTVAWQVDSDQSLQNALIAGEGNIESTRVMEDLLDIAAAIEEKPHLKEVLLSISPEEAFQEIQKHSFIKEALTAYLEAYGDRCAEELKLESTPVKERPEFAVGIIQNYLRHPNKKTETDNIPSNVRIEAEKILRKRLGGGLSPKYIFYTFILNNARAAIKNRENQRLARTRAFALVRRIYRSIGNHLSEMNLLNDAEDILFLEINEVQSFIRGTLTAGSLKPIVDIRKKDYKKFHQLPPLPDHFVTYGISSVGFTYNDIASDAMLADTENHLLSGLGACPGVVEKKATVLFTPDVNIALNGSILVTRQTDPAWVILFPSISGLVVERGSMLSHSAIVAREMGIPAVVGVRQATARIKTDDIIKVNGSTGIVELVEKNTTSESGANE